MKMIKLLVEKYHKELSDIQAELKTLPLGSLLGRKWKNTTHYYHEINGKQVGITKNPAKIKELARKKFLLAREKQLTTLTKLLARITKSANLLLAPKELIATFANTYKNLPASYYYHPSIEKWLAQPYKKNTYNPEELIYQSKGGTFFRSKSERDIGNLLEEYDIPYRYDSVVTLNGKNEISPDFIIKAPYTGETIILEHNGALHKDGYKDRMNDKMDTYLKHGFIEGETLICTFEYHLRDHDRIRKIIEEIILKH
ncbi:MAG: hypothetical protein FWE07_03245 [Turicibacter sp.]|nr:hypothetical protein [Turicibacter sp.]